MKIKDILLQDYERLSSTEKQVYDLWFDYVKANNTVQNKQSKGHNDWTFDEVAYLRNYINDFDKVDKILDICFNKLNKKKLYLFEILAWRKFVIDELEKIVNLEARLESQVEPELELAGIDELNKFKEWNTKIDLAQQFGQKPQDIGKWLWQDVFVVMWRNNTVNKIQKRYQDLIQKKNGL